MAKKQVAVEAEVEKLEGGAVKISVEDCPCWVVVKQVDGEMVKELWTKRSYKVIENDGRDERNQEEDFLYEPFEAHLDVLGSKALKVALVKHESGASEPEPEPEAEPEAEADESEEEVEDEAEAEEEDFEAAGA